MKAMRKQWGLVLVSVLVILVFAAGCGQVTLTSQEVKGSMTSLQMDLPFTLEQQPQEQTTQNPYVKSITNNMITQAKGMDFHMTQFTTYVLDQEAVQKAGTGEQAKLQDKILSSYLLSFEKHVKATEQSRESNALTIGDHEATVTTLYCKMKGEDEVIKVVFLPLPQEDWFISFAYPKEHEKDQGKLADQIIASIQVK